MFTLIATWNDFSVVIIRSVLVPLSCVFRLHFKNFLDYIVISLNTGFRNISILWLVSSGSISIIFWIILSSPCSQDSEIFLPSRQLHFIHSLTMSILYLFVNTCREELAASHRHCFAFCIYIILG